MTKKLDQGISLAISRQAVCLEAELRIARGMALAFNDPSRSLQDFERAVFLGERAKSPFLTGLARLEMGTRLSGSFTHRKGLVERAEGDLQAFLPWAMRARLALATILSEVEPDAARTLVRSVAPRFGEMEMEGDANEARALASRLG